MARNGREQREPARALGPLRGLLPFLAPYRWMVFGALVALTATAALSLALPLAVRRVVDGFFAESLALMDAFFAAAIGIAALLALGTALRYWLVIRLGGVAGTHSPRDCAGGDRHASA